MKISKEDAVLLFEALNYREASGMHNEVITKKLNNLNKAYDQDEGVRGEKAKELFTAVFSALEDGQTIKLIVGGSEPVTTKTKNGKMKASKNGGPAKAKAKTKASKNGNGKPGIVDTIVEVLHKASKSDPVSKEQVHKILCKKFPDRDEDKLLTTVKSQIPTGLRWHKGLEVTSVRNNDGVFHYLPSTKSNPKIMGKSLGVRKKAKK